MNWIAATVELEAGAAQALADALLEVGAVSVDLSDAAAGSAAEQPVYDEPSVPGPAMWPRARLTAMFPEDEDPRAAIARACSKAGLGPIGAIAIEVVEDQDWVRKTQDQFTPVRISDGLWIVPSWHAVPDPDAVNVVLDPGLAFGTGTHPTTQLVLRWLERTVHGGETVLDYGCGSGILGIAAMKLGAGAAWGIDVDPQALLAARHNAVQNRIELQLCAAAEASMAAVQIAVANILAHPLIVLAPLLAGRTRQGGSLALSGILQAQAAEVLAAYTPWFDIAVDEQQEDWVLLSGRRR